MDDIPLCIFLLPSFCGFDERAGGHNIDFYRLPPTVDQLISSFYHKSVTSVPRETPDALHRALTFAMPSLPVLSSVTTATVPWLDKGKGISI